MASQLILVRDILCIPYESRGAARIYYTVEFILQMALEIGRGCTNRGSLG